jgi:deoxycytidine triphosphate deaminase
MVLGNKEICSICRMEPSSLGIEPFHEEQVGPASYDLRLGDDFIGPGGRAQLRRASGAHVRRFLCTM